MMDAVVGWQVKGRLVRCCCSHNGPKGGREGALLSHSCGRLCEEKEGKGGLKFAEEPFRNIWSAPFSLSVFIPFSLSHSVLVSLSLLLPHIHSLV